MSLLCVLLQATELLQTRNCVPFSSLNFPFTNLGAFNQKFLHGHWSNEGHFHSAQASEGKTVNSFLRTTIINTTEWWLQEQKFISSPFWRLQVQDQGVGRVGLILMPLSLACTWSPSPLSSHGLSSVHVCVLISSSYKDTSPVGLGSTLLTWL